MATASLASDTYTEGTFVKIINIKKIIKDKLKMGGRRKSTKIQKKEKPITIRTIFDCAICGYKNCIFVKMYLN